jgi:hypothetical protein
LATDSARDTALAHPFLRPTAGRRQEKVSSSVSTLLVAVLHVLFFFLFVISVRPFDMRNRQIVETILELSAPGNNARRDLDDPELANAPPRMLSAPITIVQPPPIVIDKFDDGKSAAPGDILGAVGRELACSAGSWEHLTSVERTRCGLYPWRGVKLPNGNLVMIPRSVLPRLREVPDSELGIVSGEVQIQRDRETGQQPGMGGCPIMQNTPCLHVTPGYRAATGQD